ncbi:MAG: zinc ribbon domain-containing protein [Bacillota bacterium]
MDYARILWDIQHIYERLARHRQDIKNRRKKLAALEPAASSRKEYAELSGRLAENLKRRRQLEAELELNRLHQKELEKKIYGGSIGQAKELSQMEQKLQEYKHRQVRLEDEMLALMEGTEEISGKIEALGRDIAREEAEIDSFRGKLQKELKALEPELEKAEDEFNALWLTLPEEQQKLFQNLYKQFGGKGVVRLENNLCTGCRVEVSTRFMNGIKDREMIYCENCGRLLVR